MKMPWFLYMALVRDHQPRSVRLGSRTPKKRK
jgi:hypothetical protein